MKRIAIIGSSGSGKTTLSNALAEKLRLPLYHLDGIFWNSDKTNITKEEFDKKLGEILIKDSWIIDGDYSRTYIPRFEAADTIIFLDYPLDVCLQGVQARVGTKRCDLPWVETEFDPEFRQWIIDWHEKRLPVLRDLLEKYRGTKRVITFKSRQEAAQFLQAEE